MSRRKPASTSSGDRLGNRPLTRREVLRWGTPVAVGLTGISPVAALSLDGKGNDVCPCVFDISSVASAEDSLLVTGPCGVADPPEDVVVQVHVIGRTGAGAFGRDSVECEGISDDPDSFAVHASIRGAHDFETGDPVDVDATAHVNSGTKAAIVGRWSWSGEVE